MAVRVGVNETRNEKLIGGRDFLGVIWGAKTRWANLADYAIFDKDVAGLR